MCAAAFEFAPDSLWAREVTNLEYLRQQIRGNEIPHLAEEVDLSSAVEYVTVSLIDLSLSGLEFADKVPSFHLFPFRQVRPGFQEPPKLTFVDINRFDFVF